MKAINKLSSVIVPGKCNVTVHFRDSKFSGRVIFKFGNFLIVDLTNICDDSEKRVINLKSRNLDFLEIHYHREEE